MIFKFSEDHNANWHLEQADKLQKEIRILKAELKHKENIRQQHLDTAEALMQGQLTFE